MNVFPFLKIFQRAKMKKIQRKSKQDGDKTSDKDSSKDDKGKYCS